MSLEKVGILLIWSISNKLQLNGSLKLKLAETDSTRLLAQVLLFVLDSCTMLQLVERINKLVSRTF
jgi:hypothetical protein